MAIYYTLRRYCSKVCLIAATLEEVKGLGVDRGRPQRECERRKGEEE